MTYRLLLWFDMLEEEGKSTDRLRVLFANRTPPLSKDLSLGNSGNRRYSKGNGNSNTDGNGYGGFDNNYGSGSGNNNGGGSGYNYIKIMAVRI